MPRQPRYRIAGLPQHVIQRGNDRKPTFFTAIDYHRYKTWLALAAREHGCRIHAYVLMTNHVHLLVTPVVADGLAPMMQSLGRRYVRYVNQTYGRTGTLWEGRYKACLVQADAYLMACQRYVELNPVRAGMVTDPGQYDHSSYRHNALGCTDPLVEAHTAYRALGPDDEQRRQAYRRLFEHGRDAGSSAAIRRVTASCQVLGNDRFKDEVEAMLARGVRPGRPGRPSKIAV